DYYWMIWLNNAVLF
nr:immunoglobulin light chain junction region [Macaca mulatta]